MDRRTDRAGTGWFWSPPAVGGPSTVQGGSQPQGTVGDSPQGYTRTCWGVLGARTVLSGGGGESTGAPKGPGGAPMAMLRGAGRAPRAVPEDPEQHLPLRLGVSRGSCCHARGRGGTWGTWRP